MKKALVLTAVGLFLGGVWAQDGSRLYAQYCAGCHQPAGQGVAGAFPPLTGLEPFFKDPRGRSYLVQVVAFGLQGPLKVGNVTYNGLMPALAQLKDEEILQLLNYLGQSFGNKNPKPFTLAEVQEARAKRLSPQEVLKGRPSR
ncbi:MULTISPECIES: c-type cytochrome [Thermus]|uniref:c-type cytochrome n=1 Tax=Thermus TaxID=270 RepID=UPI001F3D6F74|nr:MULTISPECIES: cytochrome c [Thermus]